MKLYLKRHVDETNPHRFWELVNTFNGCRKQSAIRNLARIHCHGDISILVEKINYFFSSISSDLAPIDHPKLEKELDISSKYLVTVEQMEKRLMDIKLNKFIGPDGIPNWIVRDFAPSLAPSLTTIFNSTLYQDHVPSLWKMANVTPPPLPP